MQKINKSFGANRVLRDVDFSLSNYVSFAFDIITIITNLIGIATLTAEARKSA